MILVKCINGKWAVEPAPQQGEVYEVEGSVVNPENNATYFYLAGFDDQAENGNRMSFNSVAFRLLEFPPSIEKEITESLTRELILK